MKYLAASYGVCTLAAFAKCSCKHSTWLIARGNQRQGGDGLKPKYEQQMKKGVLEMLVLQLLSEKEKYGYQLICELREQSDDMFLLKEGTLYPILYRMEDDGLVVSRWSEPKGKESSRKYYSITAEGVETLGQLQVLWGRFSEKVDTVMKSMQGTVANDI